MYRIVVLLGICLSLICASCEYSDSIGLDLVTEEQFDMIFLDTATVEVSTVMFDSLTTSGTGRILTGHHADETFGDITALSFFQVGLDSLSDYPDERYAAYKRTSLLLYYDNYSYYDTTQLQTYYLYRLTEDIEYEDDGKLYNTNQFAFDSTHYLGMVSAYIRSTREGEYVEMSLEDSLGSELFELAQENDDLLNSETDFLRQYKGFVLVPDQANTAIVGFSNKTLVKIYYQEGGEEKELVFPISDQIHFTQVIHDKSQSKFAPLVQQRYELPADETDQVALLQGGTGLAIRIEFPHIQSLLALGNGVYITEAYLKMDPIKGTFGNYTSLPTTLSVYKVDGLNRILETYDFEFTLYLDQEFKEDSYYSLPLANFLNEELDIVGTNSENALLVVLPEEGYSKTVDRLVVGERGSEDPSSVELFLLKNYRNQ